MKGFLTLQEACKYLGIKRMTLYHLLWRGKIPGYKIGRQWRFDKDELKSSLKRQTKSYYAKRNKTKERELVYGKGKKSSRSRR